MAKLREDPITAEDLLEFVERESSFAFELEVLNHIGSGWHEADQFADRFDQLTHSGTFTDFLTGKKRQFDIQGWFRFDERYDGVRSLGFALECKSIGDAFPLVALRVPRKRAEAFNDVTVSTNLYGPQKRLYVRLDRASCFRPGDSVAKSVVQVGRSASRSGELTATDSDMFPRWTQAVHSAHHMFLKKCVEEMTSARKCVYHVATIQPVMVVPDNTLWAIDYKEGGSIAHRPEMVDHVELWCDQQYPETDDFGKSFTVSHVDILTLSGLRDFIVRRCRSVRGGAVHEAEVRDLVPRTS